MRVNVWSFITTETLVLSRKWLAAVIETAGTNDTNIKIPGVYWRVCNMDFYGVYICLVDRECQWCVNFAAGAVQERANQCSQGKKGDSTWATEMTFNCTWAVGLYWYMYASMKNKSIMAFSASGAIKGSVSDSTYSKHTDQKNIQIFLSFFCSRFYCFLCLLLVARDTCIQFHINSWMQCLWFWNFALPQLIHAHCLACLAVGKPQYVITVKKFKWLEEVDFVYTLKRGHLSQLIGGSLAAW